MLKLALEDAPQLFFELAFYWQSRGATDVLVRVAIVVSALAIVGTAGVVAEQAADLGIGAAEIGDALHTRFVFASANPGHKWIPVRCLQEGVALASEKRVLAVDGVPSEEDLRGKRIVARHASSEIGTFTGRPSSGGMPSTWQPSFANARPMPPPPFGTTPASEVVVSGGVAPVVREAADAN